PPLPPAPEGAAAVPVLSCSSYILGAPLAQALPETLMDSCAGRLVDSLAIMAGGWKEHLLRSFGAEGASMSAHEPSTLASVAETASPSRQGPLELPPGRDTPRAPRAARRTGLRALRWLAHGWWRLFAIVIVGNFLPGAVLEALQGGLGAL